MLSRVSVSGRHLQLIETEIEQFGPALLQDRIGERIGKALSLHDAGGIPMTSEHKPRGNYGVEMWQEYRADETVKLRGIRTVLFAVSINFSEDCAGHRADELSGVTGVQLRGHGGGRARSIDARDSKQRSDQHGCGAPSLSSAHRSRPVPDCCDM
jgi:hypothetical protein